VLINAGKELVCTKDIVIVDSGAHNYMNARFEQAFDVGESRTMQI